MDEHTSQFMDAHKARLMAGTQVWCECGWKSANNISAFDAAEAYTDHIAEAQELEARKRRERK